MPTIKRKVEMNLPQLIEWGFNNPKEVESKIFESDKIDYFWNIANVQFSNDGYGVRVANSVSVEDTFTVEIEEEITEDTELDLIERFIGGTGSVCYTSHTMTIKECLKRTPEACKTTHLYIENDERELVLIWHEGKLVE
ncbi:hypothetical protein [Mammaliicoccus sp. D-M17]|uniref:hypothetical protein n=1 Tax=Mammaliicoccus sp. D-M17 TaxID=2898677 RepID=UPI001EFBEF0A|nr:hypothetical protein [Mammaliicoccus sp. D-M17]